MIVIVEWEWWRTSFKTSAILDKNSSLRSFINGTLFKKPTRSSNRLIAEVFMICWYATLSKVHTLTSSMARNKYVNNSEELYKSSKHHNMFSFEIVVKYNMKKWKILFWIRQSTTSPLSYLSPMRSADSYKVWPSRRTLRQVQWNRPPVRFGLRRTFLRRPHTNNSLQYSTISNIIYKVVSNTIAKYDSKFSRYRRMYCY